MRLWVGLLLLLSAVSTAAGSEDTLRLAPGDDKDNYESSDYRTNSLALAQRTGAEADLLQFATHQQTGLPTPVFPADNPPDAIKIALGRKLFFDRRLSRNKTMSCAMCHIPEQGFTSNEVKRPIGFEGRAIKRNAPTILNVAYYPRLFQDAREFTLEQQVWSPLLAANEMNNASIGIVIDTLRRASDYAGLFEQAFKTPPTMQNIGMALAQYQRSLLAGNSRFDQYLFKGEQNALSEEEIRGYRLFIGKAGCVSCHLIGPETALFTDHQMHNTGLGYDDSLGSSTVHVQLAPGVFTTLDRATVNTIGEQKPNDLGHYEVTLQPADRWKFRTPSLRNIALTAPYMHNGELLTLEDVVAFYNAGGIAHDLLSPLIHPLALTSTEQAAIVAFLRSLNGASVKSLVADAFAAPIGDARSAEK